ncbi:transposase [Streptomyces sp. ISL-98]|uniref:transposase n=1 Tax=Streptomyces sp. ISL-98 TaxID=2819192 RepID=UPI001BE7FF60|nr:transposase [Streptomyces sp. ISL-98]MBT2505341.1 transposase [Streptomyces sp. ISL-98]
MKRPGRRLEPLDVTDEERRTLESWVRRRRTAQSHEAKDMALRAQIVLASTRPGDDGHPVTPGVVANRLGISYETAAKWRSRFVEDRLDGLAGPDVPFVPDVPADKAAHRPAPPGPFAEPFDPDEVYDVVGLYLAPPERAVALCTAEKPSHTAPPAEAAALLSALDATTGEVLGSLHRRHRAVEFRRFLSRVDGDVPEDLQVHVVCDNYATHRSPTVKTWLLAHPRFHPHFTPADSPWPTLRLGSVPAVEEDVRLWSAAWDAAPKPYVWTA